MKTLPAPTIFELFGQPGAGKTTLVSLVAAETAFVTNAQLAAAWRKRSSLYRSALIARALFDPAILRAAQIAIKGSLANRNSLTRLARLVAKSRWIRSQNGPLLLEEGPLQEVWSIFYSAGRLQPNPAMLSPLLRSIYGQANAHIVHIHVDPEVALSRVSNRTHGRSRLDRLPFSMLRTQLIETGDLPCNIADAARSAGLHVETLDGSEPIPALVDQLRSIVARVGALERTEHRL